MSSNEFPPSLPLSTSSVSLLPHLLSRLLNPEGSLMAFAGKSDKKENITAAVAANIWMSNEKSAKSVFQDENLLFIVMDCEV